MSLRVTIVDEQTDDTETVRIPDGEYFILTTDPCRVASVQAYPTTGTVQLTIKGHGPQHLPPDPRGPQAGDA